MNQAPYSLRSIGMMSMRMSSSSGCSAGTMIPARLGSAKWKTTWSLFRLPRISIKLLPLKPMLMLEPLYSQANTSLAEVEKSMSSEETSKRPLSIWKRISWLLSLANGKHGAMHSASPCDLRLSHMGCWLESLSCN